VQWEDAWEDASPPLPTVAPTRVPTVHGRVVSDGERCASDPYEVEARCASGLYGAGERCASGLYGAGERCASGLYGGHGPAVGARGGRGLDVARLLIAREVAHVLGGAGYEEGGAGYEEGKGCGEQL
jgi:hypothetical protein